MNGDGSGAVDVSRPAGTRLLPPNDLRQYDDLAGEWWRPDGAFALLYWLAEARARLIPPASRPGSVLVDLGCGAGLLAPYVAGKGYRHVGVDLVRSALEQAGDHGLVPAQADAKALPLVDGCADVVSAGEVLEHVPQWPVAVAEACRVLRPGGLLVLDTLNDTAVSRLLAVRLADRMPGMPRGIHDPHLLVNASALVSECARHGVSLRLRGVRPRVWPLARWVARRAAHRPARPPGRSAATPIVPTWSTAVLYQGWGVKRR
jgi:2-polyprenyl-6-hydroxyphenyl methylase/3-demethylubiquinone-9 3-methyltransferase